MEGVEPTSASQLSSQPKRTNGYSASSNEDKLSPETVNICQHGLAASTASQTLLSVDQEENSMSQIGELHKNMKFHPWDIGKKQKNVGTETDTHSIRQNLIVMVELYSLINLYINFFLH